jgi:transposase InsO family protein
LIWLRQIIYAADITYVWTQEGWLYVPVVESFFGSLKQERVQWKIY